MQIEQLKGFGLLLTSVLEAEVEGADELTSSSGLFSSGLSG